MKSPDVSLKRGSAGARQLGPAAPDTTTTPTSDTSGETVAADARVIDAATAPRVACCNIVPRLPHLPNCLRPRIAGSPPDNPCAGRGSVRQIGALSPASASPSPIIPPAPRRIPRGPSANPRVALPLPPSRIRSPSQQGAQLGRSRSATCATPATPTPPRHAQQPPISNNSVPLHGRSMGGGARKRRGG